MARIARRNFLPFLVSPLLASPLLAACGFHPVYGPGANGQDSPAAAALAEISIGQIPERSGQMLRLALQERFERAGVAAAHRYDLTVAFALTSEALGVQQDSTATWVRLVGTANYSLIAQDPSRKTVTSGAARSVDGYNLFDQQYFAGDQENDAVEKRLSQQVADQIALQLASFFAKRTVPATG